MVSALWKACSQGDLKDVVELLKESSTVDIEIKDHTGSTPLIEAVKNGNVEIVRALLDKGADPNNVSSHGRPQQYTSDSVILDLLDLAQRKVIPNGMPMHESGYVYDVPNPDAKGYYPPHPESYGYYPSTAPPGAVYYSQPQPPPSGGDPNGPGHLPPPEVARFIPCRYFPACRYGSSCMFAHPPEPYLQGPLPPPAQYPALYDPSTGQQQPSYAPNYYSVSSFPAQPNGGPSRTSPISPMSPQSGPQRPLPSAALVHDRTGSEPITSPIPDHNGAPPPVPYGHMSPVSHPYPHSGQVPLPLPIAPLPPLHNQPSPSGPQSAPAMYNGAPPFTVRPGSVSQYPPLGIHGCTGYSDVNAVPKSSPIIHSQVDGFTHNACGAGRPRGGSFRRGSFSGRKPPCLFFPSGRCRNGDDCRFPHVMPEGLALQNPPVLAGRTGPRPRGSSIGGVVAVNEKLADLTVRDGVHSRQRGNDRSIRSPSTDAAGRQRASKTNHLPRTDKDRKHSLKQRVPNPDEFPVLAGTVTPPTRSPGSNGSVGHGYSGPTAAQILQAPAPVRRDSTKDSSTRVGTPDSSEHFKEFKSSPKGIVLDACPELHSNTLPLSFASIATSTPDLSKDVSVSA